MKTTIQFLKNYFFFILVSVILLNLSGCTMLQTITSNGTPIPHHVNTIIIDFDGTKKEAFAQIGNHFIQNRYSIATSSSEFFTVTTNYKNVAQKGSDMATVACLTASVIEQEGKVTIILFGIGKQGMDVTSIGGIDIGEFEIEHYGTSISMLWLAWSELYRIASSFSDRLTFEKR
ncbi:hypothetical protein ACFLTI_09400 [Bacteroidota bacterium]